MDSNNIVATVDVTLENLSTLDAEFGTVYIVTEDGRVLYALTQTWNSQPELIAKRGFIYIYADYRDDGLGGKIPAIKVGDGLAYLIDLPFTDDLYAQHIANTYIHVTSEDKERWDNKVTCFLDPTNNETLIFSKT